MRSSIKMIFTCALTCFCLANSYAQTYTRFAVTSSVGMNQMWTAVNPGAGFSWNNSISFTPHYLFMAEGELETGHINGKVLVYGDNSIATTSSFSTSYTYKGGAAGINLLKVFAPRKRQFRVIPYIYAGVGFLNFHSERFSENGSLQKTYEFNTYTTKIGFRLKVKINNQLDWVASFEHNSPQSFYVDASPVPKGYDRFTSVKFGVSYKIAATKKRTHIDWNPRVSKKCNAWFDYSGKKNYN
ncbi:MAG: hypothetical protein V4658_09745 [Bacteroidota bacterium]